MAEAKSKVAVKVEITLADGTIMRSIDPGHASDIYQWWCQCEEFASLSGHRYPLNKSPLEVIKPKKSI